MKLNASIFILLFLGVFAVCVYFLSFGRNNAGGRSFAEGPADSQRNAQRSSSGAPRPGRSPSSTIKASTRAWEMQIDRALSSKSITNDEACKELLNIAANKIAPEAIRADALDHALNLVLDVNYQWVQHIMKAGGEELPRDLQQVIFEDTFNRSNKVKLTTAMLMMESSHVEIRNKAKELIEFQIDQKLGDTLSERKAAIQKFLEDEK